MKDQNYEGINVNDLTVGMYVILPLSWHEHPFVKNQFIIKSDSDIDKIKSLGLKEIRMDPSRSVKCGKQIVEEDIQPPASVEDGKEQKRIHDELTAVIQDQALPSERKALLVQGHSIRMMKNLLDNPSSENIREAKKGISAIVNLILNDNDTLRYLANITSHDYYTYTHSVQVGILSVALAKSLFRDSKRHDLYALGAGFFLHDLGKVGINKDIINKPGKLTDDEMRDMRRHPALGYKLLYETGQLTEESRIIVLQHHERIDGTGYPKGICGSEIHIYGKICTIADVYDALTTDRPYRKKMMPYEALRLMRDEMMNHFQKNLFEAFIMLFRTS